MGCGASNQNKQQQPPPKKEEPVTTTPQPIVDPPTAWMNAASPDYTVNTNQYFAFSETPDITQGTFPTYGFTPAPLTTALTYVEVYGQGQVTANGVVYGIPSAYNVNYQYQTTTDPAGTVRKIPNRVPFAAVSTPNASAYIQGGLATNIILSKPNVPTVGGATLTEVSRLLDPVAGEVVCFGYQTTELVALYNALPTSFVNNTLANLTIYSSITLTPQIAFTGQTTAIADFLQCVDSGTAATYALCGAQLQNMYSVYTQDSNQIPAFMSALPAVEVFPVAYAAAIAIQTASGDWNTFLTTYVSNANVVLLVKSIINGTTVVLSQWNNSVGQQTYLNGNGNGWDDNNYQLTTDPTSVRSGPVFNWLPSYAGDGDCTFSCTIGQRSYVLVAAGSEWSGGPTYWSLATTGNPSAATVFSPDYDANGNMHLLLSTPGGVSALNGMGAEWSGGPSWFVTSELVSGGGNFAWTVATATS